MTEPTRDEITQRTMAAMLPKLLASPTGYAGPGGRRVPSPRAQRRLRRQVAAGELPPRAKTGRVVRDHPLASPLPRGPKVTRYGAIIDEVSTWADVAAQTGNL